ncbi:hypothetical protein RF55_20672 [Lasius niger]|uniref:Uncharacterized protein n=1 Tax=Lasius niger TaxID=67767 RepID=A0A0J7JYN2_LASNI|nr:hypothetical protein RF55_20672 [Lasius niger]
MYVAGLLNNCEETWKYLKGFDILGLTETWIDGWKKAGRKLKEECQINSDGTVRRQEEKIRKEEQKEEL